MARMIHWTVFLMVAGVAFAARLEGIAQQPEQDAQGTDNARASQPGEMMCPMMAGLKNIQVFADGPALLLAQQQKLNLTDEQQRKLKEIQDQARRQARDVLTDEQRQKLEDVPDKRISLMQWNMMQMREMRDQDKNMCPMCMEMMRKRMRGQGRPDREETNRD